jgi:hypothetical protein
LEHSDPTVIASCPEVGVQTDLGWLAKPTIMATKKNIGARDTCGKKRATADGLTTACEKPRVLCGNPRRLLTRWLQL